MKFGLQNPYWRAESGPAGLFEEVRQRAQWAETHGFDWFSVMDHLIQIGGIGPPEEPMMESWTMLAALAAVTRQIRLSALVTSVSYRNPALLAKMAATVDVISGGRLTLGIGAGWFEEEYRQYGFNFPGRPAERIAQLEEAVELIKRLWTEPKATFEGNYFRVQNAILEPKPLQKPHPPVLIGGEGRRLTLRAVARHADLTNVFGSPISVREKYAVLERHCEAVGRPYEAIERSNITELLLARSEGDLNEKKACLQVPDDYWGHAVTVSEAQDLVGAYEQAGVQLFICSFRGQDAQSLALFAEEVMPAFQGV